MPARWACEHCQINFCTDCIAIPKPGKLPSCPVCQRDLTSLGSGNLVTPFWQRLGRFFLYPFYPTPLLITWAMVGAGTGIVALFANSTLGLFSMVVLLVLLVGFAKYAYVVLEDTAHGHLTPRPYTNDLFTDNMVLPFKQLALMFAFGGVIFTVFDMFGYTMGWLAYTVIILTLPASTMVLAMEHSFFSAFNPLLIFTVIKRIGLPYLFMMGLLYLLSAALSTSQALLLTLLSPKVAAILLAFTGLYFWLVTFNLMGYVLYQYHEQLGYSVEIEAEVHAQPNAELTVSPELRATEILIAEGKSEQAAQRLAELIIDMPGNVEARERILKVARLNNDLVMHTKQGQEYISYLFHENKIGLAAKVYQNAVGFDKQFRPVRAHERVEIAQMLRANGQAKMAVTLLANLHTEFPSFDGIPAAYLLAAKMLCEHFSDDAKARQILQFVLKYYPSHALVPEVQDYLGVVEKLAVK
ncbi:MAG: hypothetical protein HY080_08320 [Gammaproteobacteria bacterium]|nr:hypothetical protein [Gammaproteobacteria bacterium]